MGCLVSTLKTQFVPTLSSLPSDEMIDFEEKEISILFDNLIEKLLERKNFSSKLVEKTCVLASVLGNMFVGGQISEKYGLLQGLYKDINLMMQLNTHEFLKGRNAVLVAFLRSIAPSKNPNSYQLAEGPYGPHVNRVNFETPL